MQNENNGWIDPNIELPPIGVEVITTYSNHAYGDMRFVSLAERISDTHFRLIRANGTKGLIIPFEKHKNLSFGSFIHRWVFDENQETIKLCECDDCKKLNK